MNDDIQKIANDLGITEPVNGSWLIAIALANGATEPVNGSWLQALAAADGGVTEGWVRPADWLTMPALTSTDDEIAILHAVWDNDSNFAAFRCTTSTGNYEVDWGDGTVTSHASNTTAEHQYDYSTYDIPGTTLSSRGYKQAIIRITPLIGLLRSFNTNFRYTGQNQSYSSGFLDVLLSIPNTITSDTISFSGTFVPHRYLEQVHILNIGGITTVNSMFNACSSLQSVPLFDTSNVTIMSSMFTACLSLQSVPLFDTSNVTSMQSMFGSCRALQSVPLFDTSNVTNISGMFFDASALQSVPLFDTSNVTNMQSMFNGCLSLQSVPLFNTPNVTNMSSMFNACSSLQSVPLFNTHIVTTMNTMFRSCFAIQEIPAFNTSSINTTFQNFATSASSMSKTDIIFRKDVIISNCQLSRDGIVNIFNNLIDLTALTAQNINITNNYGAAALSTEDRDIALNKNWTITG